MTARRFGGFAAKAAKSCRGGVYRSDSCFVSLRADSSSCHNFGCGAAATEPLWFVDAFERSARTCQRGRALVAHSISEITRAV
ncbi:MAG TPA: hypothetical protein VHM90_12320, partial [Phycisphaerae bacterium]|nr:hypothetical protein [Phycisphaerae bacterium]